MFKIHIYSYFYFKSKIQIIKFPKNSIHQNQNRLIKTYNITYTLNLYYIFKFIRYFSYHSAFFSYFFPKNWINSRSWTFQSIRFFRSERYVFAKFPAFSWLHSTLLRLPPTIPRPTPSVRIGYRLVSRN